KILNTWELDAHQIAASEEVHNISIALGIDPGSAELSQLRYHKICILADSYWVGQAIPALPAASFSSLAGCRSTAMTRPAPMIRAALTAFRPTPPAPRTTTVSPAATP